MSAVCFNVNCLVMSLDNIGRHGRPTLPVDTDLDGVTDDVDNCLNVSNADQSDKDHDGLGDVCDNCPFVPNPDQANTNGNDTGDVCEMAGLECSLPDWESFVTAAVYRAGELDFSYPTCPFGLYGTAVVIDPTSETYGQIRIVGTCDSDTGQCTDPDGWIEDFPDAEDLMFPFAGSILTIDQFRICRHEIDNALGTGACTD